MPVWGRCWRILLAAANGEREKKRGWGEAITKKRGRETKSTGGRPGPHQRGGLPADAKAQHAPTRAGREPTSTHAHMRQRSPVGSICTSASISCTAALRLLSAGKGEKHQAPEIQEGFMEEKPLRSGSPHHPASSSLALGSWRVQQQQDVVPLQPLHSVVQTAG